MTKKKVWSLLAALFLVTLSGETWADKPPKSNDEAAAELASPAQKRYEGLLRGDPAAIKASVGLFSLLDADERCMWSAPILAGGWPESREWPATIGCREQWVETTALRLPDHFKKVRTMYRGLVGPFLALLYTEHEPAMKGKAQEAARAVLKILNNGKGLSCDDDWTHCRRLAWIERKGGLGNKAAVQLFRSQYKSGEYEKAMETAVEFGLGDKLVAKAKSGIQPKPESMPEGPLARRATAAPVDRTVYLDNY